MSGPQIDPRPFRAHFVLTRAATRPFSTLTTAHPRAEQPHPVRGGTLAIIEPREIACDESGYEGESLVGGVTDVFAHAGVSLSTAAAAGCVTELRRRIRSPALEYKANHLLRGKNRAALEWLLGPDGPIHGHAHVHLVDKTLLLVRKVVEVVDGSAAEALDLHRRRFEWAAFNDFLRPRTRQGGPASVAAVLDGLPTDAGPVVDRLRRAGPRLAVLRAQLLDDPGVVPALDPLVPAILRAVALWGEAGRVPVAIVHDRQTSLTADRLTALMAGPGAPASLRFVDSRTDPRIQVADFLAGVAMRATSDQLAGRGDAGLLELLRPYVDPASIWA